MKNIAIFIPTIKPGGAEKQATLLATLLDGKYHVDMYLNLGMLEPSSQNYDLIKSSGVVLHPLEGSAFKKLKVLSKSLKDNNVEVLFNYMTHCNVIGYIAGRRAGVKKIYGGIRSSSMSVHKIILDFIIHNFFSTGTVYNCYSGCQDIGKWGFRLDKSFVIPNCFPNISPVINRKDKVIKHIVTVGRFVAPKDYETAIKAISELKKLRDDFVFDAIGYGEEEEKIRKWIIDYEVDDKVIIHIRPNNVQDIVRDADIYLSTSVYEGTSNSILEALNWSLPVVATNVGDNNRLVIDGENGYLHPIGDFRGIAKSLNTLLGDSLLRNKMGELSNNLLRKQYSTDIFVEQYIKLIEEE